jgi:hypothetical protein
MKCVLVIFFIFPTTALAKTKERLNHVDWHQYATLDLDLVILGILLGCVVIALLSIFLKPNWRKNLSVTLLIKESRSNKWFSDQWKD